MERGDIYLVSLDPIGGHEQRGERRVLVVLTKEFNHLNSVPVVVPITSDRTSPGSVITRPHRRAPALMGTGLGS